MNMAKFKMLVGIILCIPILMWGGIRIYKSINYSIECGGHLKRAADANTVELAKTEMLTALTFIKSRNMTNGYTSVIFNTPNEDVGFWYQNLSSSLQELNEVAPRSTQLEKSNILMKLRETLLDDGKNGQHVTQPQGISVFPNNVAFMIFGLVFFVLMVLGVALIIVAIEQLEEWRR